MDDSDRKDTASIFRILAAAEETFAEKGFDGARVDEIAKRAGVNKALIYYYFESKEQILEELSKKHLNEIIDLKKVLITEFDLKHDLHQGIKRMIRSELWKYLSERKDFLSIVLIEALKNKSDHMVFFKLVNQLYDDSLTKVINMGYNIDKDSFKILAFFYGIVPVIFYLTIWEKWAEFNHIDKEKVKTTFSEALTDIEFSLFLNKFDFMQDRQFLDNWIPDKSSLEFNNKRRISKRGKK